VEARATSAGEILARRLREVRVRQGWTQQQLADRLWDSGVHLDRTTITKIERGGTRARNTSIEEALAIAAALGVSPSVLLFPLAEDELVRITPKRIVTAKEGRRWLRGEKPLDAEDALAFLTEIAQNDVQELRAYRDAVRTSIPEILKLAIASAVREQAASLSKDRNEEEPG
jgi:transcriptional regulator with XRE-family HTH domain